MGPQCECETAVNSVLCSSAASVTSAARRLTGHVPRCRASGVFRDVELHRRFCLHRSARSAGQQACTGRPGTMGRLCTVWAAALAAWMLQVQTASGHSMTAGQQHKMLLSKVRIIVVPLNHLHCVPASPSQQSVYPLPAELNPAVPTSRTPSQQLSASKRCTANR